MLTDNQEKNRTFLSLDPSTTRLGYAVFCEGKGSIHLLASDAWSFGDYEPEPINLSMDLSRSVKKFLQIRLFLRDLQEMYNPTDFVYEMPSFFNSTKGAIAARKGHTNNLALVIGMAIATFYQCRLYPYTPQQWKGNLPKEITFAKFQRTFLDSNIYKYLNHDTVDAIMLLHYHLKQFTDVNFNVQTNLS